MDKDITIHPDYKNVALFNYHGEQQPIFYYPEGTEIKALYRTFEQLDIMFSYYSKVTLILFQFNQAEYRDDNQQLSELIAKLKANLKKHYKNTRIGYAWAREHGKEGDNLHYHIALMINGSLCRSSYYLWQTARSICQSISLDNDIWLPNRNTYPLHRNSKPAYIRAARMRMSYAAKKRTKELIPKGVAKFGVSQLTFNQTQ